MSTFYWKTDMWDVFKYSLNVVNNLMGLFCQAIRQQSDTSKTLEIWSFFLWISAIRKFSLLGIFYIFAYYFNKLTNLLVQPIDTESAAQK